MGNIEKIWDEYSGSGVSAGVYDDGFETTHTDLNDNYDSTLHFVYGGTIYDPTPANSSDGHGTSVAGLIGAEAGNDAGGVGVAWGVSLTGINFLSDIQYQSFTVLLESFEWAQNFDIVSNSWGSDPDYRSHQNTSNPASVRSLMISHWQTAIESGRGGLGTIITKAAGNDNADSNGDGLNGSRYTLTIAATGYNSDFAASYSNFGADILLAAPAASVTTDLTGAGGYRSGDYTTGFGGTSAATPLVSGVVALMLEANDGLGYRDVKTILQISAAMTGSDMGAAGPGLYEDGTWSANGAGNWNGGGMSFHVNYGAGMVDAFAAVRMAEAWQFIRPLAGTAANEQTVTATYAGPAVAIADLSTVSAGIEVTQNLEIEHIDVTVSAQHSYGSDLTISLEKIVDGVTISSIVLADQSIGSTRMTGGLTWKFGVTSALGLDSAGQWQLQITDNVSADSGTLTGFSLEFFGRSGVVDDVHSFTADFLPLAGADTSRRIIVDNDGGTDWINMAAIDANVVIDLQAAGGISVDGEVWATLAAGTAIENAFGGDGNDLITGNGEANELHGARGNDFLNGAAGADSLFAGAGNDILAGGAGADSLNGGVGNDRVTYVTSASGVNVNMLNMSGNTGDAVGDTYVGIEDIAGSGFADALRGDHGANKLFGLGGGDVLFGRMGDDQLFGGAGDDLLNGGAGADLLDGGSGWDSVSYFTEARGIVLDLVNQVTNAAAALGDRLYSIESVRCTGFADVIKGTQNDDDLFASFGNDFLFGRGGDDLLYGADGDDILIGGAGTDRVGYFQAGAAVGVDLENPALNTGQAAGDVFGSIENIAGSAFDDTLRGNSLNNVILGRTGNDTLAGRGGNDTLFGGGGADVFIFDGGADSIADFEDDIDTISVDAWLWGGSARTAEGVIAEFGEVSGSDLILNFGSGNMLTLAGFSNLAGLNDDLVIA